MSNPYFILIFILIGVLLSLLAIILVALIAKKLQIGHFYLAWLYKGQKVTRASSVYNGRVYEILDEQGEVVYVGSSARPETRMLQHIREATQMGPFHVWLADMVARGVKPTVKIVAQAKSERETHRLEKQHIEELVARGVSLFNVTWNANHRKANSYFTFEEKDKP